jgi:hypothetical protein
MSGFEAEYAAAAQTDLLTTLTSADAGGPIAVTDGSVTQVSIASEGPFVKYTVTP